MLEEIVLELFVMEEFALEGFVSLLRPRNACIHQSCRATAHRIRPK